MDKALGYWRLLPRPAQLTLGAAGVALVLVLYLILSPLASIWSENQATIEALEPRIGRMLGFEESGQELQRSLERARSQLALYTYDAAQDLSGLGAVIQQQVRELAEDSGLRVSGSQPIAGEASEGIDAIAVNVELQGGVDDLEAFLQELTVATPLLQLESLRIIVPRQRPGVQATAQSINASVRVTAYRIQAS